MSALEPGLLAQVILRNAYGTDAIWNRATHDQRAEMSEVAAVFVPIFEKLTADLAAWLDDVESPDRDAGETSDRRDPRALGEAQSDPGRTRAAAGGPS